MSYLIVIKYEDAGEAAKARESIKGMSQQGLINLDDAAMVSRGQDGKLHVHNEIDKGVKWGTLIGGGLGLLIAGIFAPFAGIVIGALGGAAVGALADMGVEKKFVKEVGESLQTGESALFLVVAEANANAIVSSLGQFQGHVYQTSLPSDVEASLRAAVEANSISAAEAATRRAAAN